MQFCDMKALRFFSANKELFLLNPKKTSKYALSLLSRQFHPTRRSPAARESSLALESSKGEPHPSPSSSGRNSGNAPRVWSVFDPISGEIVTARAVEGSGEQESEPATCSSSYAKAMEEFDGEGTCGSVKEGNLSEGEGTHPGLSGYVDRIGVASEENRVSDGSDEDSVEGKSYGSVKKKGLGGVDRAPYYGRKQGLLNEKKFGVVRRGGDSVNGAVIKNISGSRKTGKSKISYVCESCGYTDGQWWGYCRACNVAGSMKQFSEAKTVSGNKVIGVEVSENVISSWLPQKARDVHPIRLSDVNRGINHLRWRIPLPGPFGSEVGRVLGGGLVPGSLVLIGGDPGVGKSTLLLQIAAIVADVPGLDGPAPVVYVSGEESVEQIGNRADRMEIGSENLFLYSNTDIEDILEKTQPLSPRALIVDSIQTVYLKGVIGSPGAVIQIKECTSALLRFAKRTNIPVLLTGHVTKAGDIAGPRLLEHIVDTVLYMEGEKSSSYRLLRPVKNRFGSTDELGVFEMAQSGLRAVSNPSEIFLSEQLSDSEVLAGLAVTVIMDGSRSFLIEIQALCVPESSVSRHVNGIQQSRAHMIISVLIKQAGLMLQQNAIFLNVVSGVTLTETAGDLAIAAAICSSYLEFPIPNNVAFIGEIGLGGELHSVPRMEKRLNTVAKLGYKECIVPKSTERYLSNLVGCEGMKIIGCKNLKEVISSIFKTHK